jgi:hypothetical protein
LRLALQQVGKSLIHAAGNGHPSDSEKGETATAAEEAKERDTMGQTRAAAPPSTAEPRTVQRARCPLCKRGGAIVVVVNRAGSVVVGVTQECRWRPDRCTYAAYTDLTVSPPVTIEL